MSSDSLALAVESLSKTYSIVSAVDRSTLFRDVVRRRARHPFRRAQREDFAALHDVSFEVERGETVGVIGSNGAGKSTLLKILSRIVGPTEGRVEVHGRLGSLLEVGTGFHPELTGRENVYFNGAILGMKRREIDREFDSIVEFSEIGRFLDTPVKRYSSGMYVRLAFAVASHLNPEILLVDEVLAVGDARFQQKCLGRMNEVTTSGERTILFVSHSMPMVQSLCPRTIFLERGRIAFDGPTPEAIDRYFAGVTGGISQEVGVFELAQVPRNQVTNPMLRTLELRRGDGHPSAYFPMGEAMEISIAVDGLKVPRHLVHATIRTDTGVAITTLSSEQRHLEMYETERLQDRIVVRIPSIPMVPGLYSIDLAVLERGAAGVRKNKFLDHVQHAGSFEVIPADVFGTGFQTAGGTFSGGVVYVDSTWEVRSDGLVAGETKVDAPAWSTRRQA